MLLLIGMPWDFHYSSTCKEPSKNMKSLSKWNRSFNKKISILASNKSWKEFFYSIGYWLLYRSKDAIHFHFWSFKYISLAGTAKSIVVFEARSFPTCFAIIKHVKIIDILMLDIVSRFDFLSIGLSHYTWCIKM